MKSWKKSGHGPELNAACFFAPRLSGVLVCLFDNAPLRLHAIAIDQRSIQPAPIQVGNTRIRVTTDLGRADHLSRSTTVLKQLNLAVADRLCAANQRKRRLLCVLCAGRCSHCIAASCYTQCAISQAMIVKLLRRSRQSQRSLHDECRPQMTDESPLSLPPSL